MSMMLMGAGGAAAGGGGATADYVVSGAGTTAANGDYFEAGTHNGKTYWQAENDAVIAWSDYDYWVIAPSLTDDEWYYDQDGLAEMPEDATWAVFMGDTPTPSVSAG